MPRGGSRETLASRIDNLRLIESREIVSGHAGLLRLFDR